MPRLRARYVVLLAVLLLVGGGVVGWWKWLVWANRQGTASYFRLKVELTYEGQPVGINVVVGCSVRVGYPIGGGTSIDTLAMADFVFAREIPDGHAISVRTKPLDGRNHDPCRGGTTANGGIRPDFLPAVIWYDRADDLSHGFAYVTRDAYRGPASRLAFGHAVIESATRDDFRRFTAHATPNLIPHYIADAMSHLERPWIESARDLTPEIVAQPWRAWPRTSWTACRGMRRWRVPPHLAEAVRQRWPADRPRLWVVDRSSARPIMDWILGAAGTQNTGSDDYIVLPSFRDDGLSKLTATTFQDGTFYDDASMADADARPGTVFCDRETPHVLYEAVTGRKAGPSDGVHWVCRMDGQTVASGTSCQSRDYLVFDRDEYIFAFFSPFKD